MKTRFKKVIRDLTSDYSRNLMLVLAIAVGVFGIGAILGCYQVVKREMTSNYRGTMPASATIEIEGSISPELIDSVKLLPGIQEAERHASILARMKVGDKWYALLLFVIDDFKNKRTNKINHISGEVEPSRGSMLVERTAFGVMQASEGDELLVKTKNGEPHKVKLSGTVHDPGLAPAWQEGAGYGYITLSTLHDLGEMMQFDQLRILVSDEPYSKPHIKERAEAVASWLKGKGYEIHEIQIPPPGKHPHQGQMDAVMNIFIVFSFLILILGSILVATSMATLMVKQIRQIGVMKTIGARSIQITGLYTLMVLILCVVSLIIAIPLSRIAAAGFYNQIAGLLNLEITDSSIPLEVPLIQIAAGIFIPLIATAFPLIRGSRISVRKALDNYGVQKVKRTWITRLTSSGMLRETFRLSIRNIFRQQSRLIMTLSLLAAGGAMFMTAMNVSEAWNKNLSRIYEQRLYDLDVRLSEPMQPDSILISIKSIKGVSAAEGWNSSSTSFIRDNAFEITSTYPDKGHGSFQMLAIPLPSGLLAPTVTKGRWLNQDESNEVVLNQLATGYSSDLKPGDSISLALQGKDTKWNVVGFTEDVGSPATAYVSLASFSKMSGSDGIKNLRVAYADRSKDNAYRMNKEVEALLERKGISVDSTVPVWLLHNAVAAHMKVLVNSLIAIAILMALVGTLGLMSTMSMNVLERTREIGVMRAIGATPARIRNLVVMEGLIIGIMSITIAIILSLVLSTYMGRFIGNMSFRTPLSLTVSTLAVGVWILIILVGSYVAAFFPARRASRITTREALAYE